MTKLSASDQLIRAKISLGKDKPFFSYIIMHFKCIEQDKMPMPTMGVDNYGNLYYDKKFVESLSDEELRGVLCHEVLHVVCEHPVRGNNREHVLFNISADAVVNNMLQMNGIRVPEHSVLPSNNEIIIFGQKIENVDKKIAEEIYDELYKKFKKMKKEAEKLLFDKIRWAVKEKEGQCDEGDEKNGGKIARKGKGEQEGKENGTDGSLGEKLNTKPQDWKKILAEAYTYSKQRGDEPGGMKRLIDAVLYGQIDWKQLLYKYITKEIPIDYTWSRPSKRSQSTGVYLPSIVKEQVEIVVSVDTSGSIGQKELIDFLSEIVSIGDTFRSNVKMTIIVCDAAIQEVYCLDAVNRETILGLEIKGGGGTSHVPVYKWIEENRPKGQLLINFTDGYTEFPERETIKTLWVISKDGTEKDIPFGDIIRFK